MTDELATRDPHRSIDLDSPPEAPVTMTIAARRPGILRIPVGTNLAEAERWMILATLRQCSGNKTRTAALLGVSLKTLYNRLNAYRAQGIELNELNDELIEVPI